jgi:hypothetical protein
MILNLPAEAGVPNDAAPNENPETGAASLPGVARAPNPIAGTVDVSIAPNTLPKAPPVLAGF